MIDPSLSLVDAARVEIGVRRGGYGHLSTVKAWAFAWLRKKVEPGQIIHRKGINLPMCRFLAAKRDLAGDALPLGPDYLCEVDSSTVLNKDVQSGSAGEDRQSDARSAKPAIECANELLIDIDLRVVMEAVKHQFTSIACSQFFLLTGDERYREAAIALNRYLMAHHDVRNADPRLRGGLPGSWPVWEDYAPCRILNWATKFLLDALALELRIRAL